MARNDSFFETLIKTPWWVSATLLVFGNIVIRTAIPAWFSGGRTPGPLGTAMQGAAAQAAPTIANYFSMVIICAMIFSLIREWFLHRGTSKNYDLPYKSREILFTPAELNFLNTLQQSLNKNYQIYGKVRLCDIIEPKNNLDSRTQQKAFNRISSKHVDFVICNARSLAIEMVIELDDRTHEQKARRARDEFLDAALEAANVPIARFPVKRAYTLRELQTKLGNFVISTQAPVEEEAVNVAGSKPVKVKPAPSSDLERCSACGSEMKVREKKSGDEAGKKFWVCTRYPECRNVGPYVEPKWF
ncbi:DUF2726 domain-containing protein [Oryzomonas sagensis]|uniref:DUF2726 domain-containing protein n=1 Tax=Oryzomonas sagensis TaxID=2603857 RepID=A0ABQ6TQB6_9BACT|nr:DUF2726 domain-containing protein [Oryzomonas sagensis]KAB0670547.1 DUF2726 domain-containing protein [Oryzomonas sagensis]